MSLHGLTGRTVVITGAAGGIGSVMTLALIAEGARVAAFDLNPHSLDTLRGKVAAAGGANSDLVTVAGDVTSESDCVRAVEQTIATFGDIAVLVNNAGVMQQVPRGASGMGAIKAWEVTADAWRTVMQVNAFGPHLMGRAVIPRMVARGAGKLVNISTGLQNMIREGAAVYGHSKAALEAMTATWAHDLKGSGVTANVLTPGGAANTPMIPDHPGIDRSKLVDPRLMGPPICWLASDESDGVSGFRFEARDWDSALDPHVAAERARQPIAWSTVGRPVRMVPPVM